jgi:hypothetical protein
MQHPSVQTVAGALPTPLLTLLAVALSAALPTAGLAQTNAFPSSPQAPPVPPESAVTRPTRDRPWSFAFGVGVISDNTLADYLEPSFDKLHGPGGGLTYNFTVARRLHEFDWRVGKIHLRPRLELPVMLTLVDENSGRFIPDLNVGVVLRWQDFPWNRFVRTTLSAGPGLSYAYHLWSAEAQRHPGEDRSQWKFWLPIEFTVALPRYPHHQFMLFIDHQSGGTLFDRGGVDAWGLGCRFEF